MIERLQRIASFLARLRLLIVLLGLFFLGLFTVSLFGLGGVANDALMMPAIAGFCWAALLYAHGRLFVQVPEKPHAGQGFFTRLSLSLRRAVMACLGLLLLATTAVVLVLTWQMLRLFFAT